MSEIKVKKFLTEEQVELERQRRQEDWARVRSATDPVEAPAEVFDNRSLYDKLKEQNDTKKKEYEDMWAAKNSFRGLDEDETSFLARIDHMKAEKDREVRRLEQQEIDEFKISFLLFVSQEEALKKRDSTPSIISKPILNTSTVVHKSAQKQLLAGIVKRKNPTETPSSSTSTIDSSSKKRPYPDDSEKISPKKKSVLDQSSAISKQSTEPPKSTSISHSSDENQTTENQNENNGQEKSPCGGNNLGGNGSDDSDEEDDDDNNKSSSPPNGTHDGGEESFKLVQAGRVPRLLIRAGYLPSIDHYESDSSDSNDSGDDTFISGCHGSNAKLLRKKLTKALQDMTAGNTGGDVADGCGE
ncbi:unnamed protein product [Didymodactylos carnosus]|uniref:FAM192A/Fyv6 N-terminal domain-containing protein n=1 Tax=Didymodactylos carnosus TaxID=1234261 RepID=A0A815AA16_9BILA|nr:unnamed protein product [Didymodactylos carnosus]CAF1254038.1 unnamed protein product [Didymodactylos carnosus]CAF3794460.1 unnamed protein product [Didymodactylos carnosus]CAF4025255.1 unnamed protein product [Didymodactylos carnosus]